MTRLRVQSSDHGMSRFGDRGVQNVVAGVYPWMNRKGSILAYFGAIPGVQADPILRAINGGYYGHGIPMGIP